MKVAIFSLVLLGLLVFIEASPQWRGGVGGNVNRGGWVVRGDASRGGTNVHGSVGKNNGQRPSWEVGGSHTGRNGVEVRGSVGNGPGGKSAGVEVKIPIPGK